MVAKCTEEELNILINKVKNNQLARLKIEKDEDDIIMNYYCLDELDPSVKAQGQKVLEASAKISITLIRKLEQLKDIIGHNIVPINYELKYDCTTGNNAPSYSISSTLPNGAFGKINENEVNIDYEKAFKDKLNEKIPNLFTKKSAKKYIPVTYGDLIQILRENEQ